MIENILLTILLVLGFIVYLPVVTLIILGYYAHKKGLRMYMKGRKIMVDSIMGDKK